MKRLSLLLASTLSLLAVAGASKANPIRDTEGNLRLNNGIYILETGEQFNNSNIPLPSEVPHETTERRSIPTDANRLSPNSINLSIDGSNLRQQINDQLGPVQNISDIEVTTNATLQTTQGRHRYAEGVVVTDSLGQIQTAVVRGAGVRKFEGQVLPTTDSISVSQREGQIVTAEFFNIRPNQEGISDSGVYFNQAGDLLIEDLQDGGDKDFNDGELFSLSGGNVSALLTESSSETIQSEDYDSWVLEPSNLSSLLGHRDEEGNLTDSYRVSLDLEGAIQLQGQVPLWGDDRPALLNGSFEYSPFASTNEYSLNGSIGVYQFITKTSTTNESDSLTVIQTPDSGPGDGAYKSIGGVIANYSSSQIFIPLWDENGNRAEEAINIPNSGLVGIYPALIQHTLEEMAIGQQYSLKDLPEGTLISYREHPENFLGVRGTYLIEDTLTESNALTAEFDGVRTPNTVDYDDALIGYETYQQTEATLNPFGVYVGAGFSLGAGNRGLTTSQTTSFTEASTPIDFSIDSQGQLGDVMLGQTETSFYSVTDQNRGSFFQLGELHPEVVLGMAYNFGGTEWSEQASVATLELFVNLEDSGLKGEVRSALTDHLILIGEGIHTTEGDTKIRTGIGFTF